MWWQSAGRDDVVTVSVVLTLILTHLIELGRTSPLASPIRERVRAKKVRKITYVTCSANVN